MALVDLATRSHIDALFLVEFRDHVGRSLTCGCNLDGPDRECDVGLSLWNVAHQPNRERIGSSR